LFNLLFVLGGDCDILMVGILRTQGEDPLPADQKALERGIIPHPNDNLAHRLSDSLHPILCFLEVDCKWISFQQVVSFGRGKMAFSTLCFQEVLSFAHSVQPGHLCRSPNDTFCPPPSSFAPPCTCHLGATRLHLQPPTLA